MKIWEIDKLILFIAFVVPGFISLKAYELLFPSQIKDSSRQIIDAITYSCINYALLFWVIILVEKSDLLKNFRVFYYFAYIFIFFIAPIIWVLVWKKIRLSKAFCNNAPHPILKPWDYVFAKGKSYWIIVTLKTGDKIAGKYGGNSFTSSSPAEEQIYLEEHWELNKNGGFKRKRTNSEGIIILSNEILTVELFKN